MSDKLEIRTLGALTICRNGVVIDFSSRKAAALLVYLAVTGRAHHREVLAELFWEERASAQASANLRAVLTRLRREVGSFLAITRQSIGMNLDSDYWLDRAAFEALLMSDSEPTEGALTRAVDLYQGDFLEGFYVGSHGFEDWSLLERERLRLRALSTLDRLVSHHLSRGNCAAGITYATRLLDMDRLREKTHQQLMQLLAHSGEREAALEQYEKLSALLADELGVEPTEATTALYGKIRSGEIIFTPEITEDLPFEVGVLANPYKGLRAFQEVDAVDFFGREVLTERLLERLAEEVPFARFLAVVGPSGCGKSSVVNAGLIPALRNGRLPGSDSWCIAETVPGTHPFDELDIVLARVAGDPSVCLLDQLRSDTRGLLRSVRRVLPDEATQLLLVIDQFEEVFTLVPDPAEVKFLLDSLYAGMTSERTPLRVVITLRADFYDRLLMYPDFSEMVRQRTEAVVPLTTDELECAICGPAERVGVSLVQGLTTTIVTEVAEQPGSLPMLQYALTELFDQRTSNILTLETFQAIGGSLGAMARRADTVYAGLEPEEQAAARQMFLRLVTLGEGTEDIRRRALRSEVESVGGEPTQTVLGAFDHSRLLTFDQDLATGEPTVELAHEAIIREWGLLRTWLDESRDDMRLQRLLSRAAMEWQRAGRDDSYLLHGSRLAQFEEWGQATNVALTQDERLFLETSSVTERLRLARQRRVRRLAFAVMAIVAIVMTALALLAFDREGQAQDARATSDYNLAIAERESEVNRSLVLANSAQESFEAGQTDLAMALALEAVDIDQPPAEAARTLREVALAPGSRAVLGGHTNGVRDITFSPDSRLGLSGGCAELSADDTCLQGELILWDLEAEVELRRLEGHTDWVNGVSFVGSDAQTALTGSGDGTLIQWNVATGDIIRRFGGHAGGINSIAMSRDGQTVVSGSDDSTLILWEVSTGEIIRRFEGHMDAVRSVAFGPDEQTIASGSDDNTLMLWDVNTGSVIHAFEGHTGAVRTVAFSPDGTTLLSGSDDISVRQWDVETGEDVRLLWLSQGVRFLAVSPDGRMALPSSSGVALWDLERWQWLGGLLDRDADEVGMTNAIAISADGRLALSGKSRDPAGGGGTVYLWNLGVSSELRRFETDGIPLTFAAISPDGEYLLTGTANDVETALLWDVERGTVARRFVGDAGLRAIYVAFSPDGRYALTGSGDWRGVTDARSLVLWDVETGAEIRRFEGHEFYLRSIAFSPDGRMILSGSQQFGPAWPEQEAGGDLFLWDAETGEIMHQFENTEDVTGIAFSRDGRRVLTASHFWNNITYWDVATGQALNRYDYSMGITDVIFGPDETTFLAAGHNGDLILWDLVADKELRRFVGHDTNVWDIDISFDGRYVISGADNGLVILWDFETGEELRRFIGHTTVVWGVTFSPDGQTAYSSSADGLLIEWQVSEWSLDELHDWISKNRYVRDFTCEERETYRIDPSCK